MSDGVDYGRGWRDGGIAWGQRIEWYGIEEEKEKGCDQGWEVEEAGMWLMIGKIDD